MTTTKKWGVYHWGYVAFGLVAFLTILGPSGTKQESLAQDATLISASTDLHPTEVFSVVERANSLSEAFATAGISYYPEDKVSFFPDPTLGLGTVVTVQRALPVRVIDGKQEKIYRTWQNTVGGLLGEKRVELGADDKISLSPSTQLTGSTVITIVRVAVTEISVSSSIPFKVVKKEDKNLDEGKTRIERAGANGTLVSTYLVTREDGVEKSRQLVRALTTVPSQDQILIVGTRPVITVRCKYNDWVLDAGIKNSVRPNDLCYRMMRESNGNPNSQAAAGYQGLFQYDPSFWTSVSAKAGYAGASIWDAKSQIYVTAWAWAHGYRGRWPTP